MVPDTKPDAASSADPTADGLTVDGSTSGAIEVVSYMSAWIWVLASLSLRHTLFEWATELPSRWKGELGRRCDCVCNPQLKAEYYLVLSDYDTSPWRSAKGSTLDPSLAGLASVASCPGSPSYRRRCADAATDSGGEEAPLQQLAGVAVSVSCESFTERGERPPAQPCLCGGDTQGMQYSLRTLPR